MWTNATRRKFRPLPYAFGGQPCPQWGPDGRYWSILQNDPTPYLQLIPAAGVDSSRIVQNCPTWQELGNRDKKPPTGICASIAMGQRIRARRRRNRSFWQLWVVESSPFQNSTRCSKIVEIKRFSNYCEVSARWWIVGRFGRSKSIAVTPRSPRMSRSILLDPITGNESCSRCVPLRAGFIGELEAKSS